MGGSASAPRTHWTTPFLNGVVSASPARALLNDASGHLVLIDLAAGRRLWRGTEPLRPLALDAERAYALRFAPVQVVALEATHGQPRWESPPLPWPGWAQASAAAAGLDGPSALHAGWAAPPSGGAALVLAWRLRRPSRGVQRAVAATDETGACGLAPADGATLTIDDEATAALLDAAAHPAVDAAAPLESAPRSGLRPARPPRGSRKLGAARRFLESADVDVLALAQHDGWRYALAQIAADVDSATPALRLVLRAEPAAAGPAAWQCPLDDAPASPRSARRPPPLP